MEVRPFKAFRFDPRVVGDVGKCIAPPYDVISDAERDELYRRSEHNIVRITRGKTTPADNGQHNQYTRAAEFLQQWIAEGALKPDEKDTIYGYVQDFELGGVAYRRLTFIALGKLEEFGKVVRPHEQVFAKPVQDRLNLKKATAARFGLVFMLYDDRHREIDSMIEAAAAGKPIADLRDEDFIAHAGGGRSVMHGLLGAVCADAGFVPRVRHDVQETSTLVTLVAAGLGVALVPEPTAALDIGGVGYRPLQPEGLGVDLLVAHLHDEVSPLLGRVLEVLRDVARPA